MFTSLKERGSPVYPQWLFNAKEMRAYRYCDESDRNKDSLISFHAVWPTGINVLHSAMWQAGFEYPCG